MTLESFEIIKILILTAVSFMVALSWAPFFIRLLVKWKIGKSIRTEKKTPIFSRLHAKKAGTPTMGGVLIWLTVLMIILFLALFQYFFPESRLGHFNFLSRGQTLLPLGALMASALVGLVDDYFNYKHIGPDGGGLRVRHRLIIYTLIAMIGAWWFSVKLDWDLLHIQKMKQSFAQ